MELAAVWQQADAVGRAVAVLLLAMSVASWSVLLWKARFLYRAERDVAPAMALFWQSTALDDALQRLRQLDREQLLLPLVQVVVNPASTRQDPAAVTLGDGAAPVPRLTRHLRTALLGVQQRLRAGQVLLASVGATAPFVGLLGTVWGIHQALLVMAGQDQVAIGEIAGPVGEALVMTAAGLAVALPAVLAYNLQGRQIARIEAGLDGFAADLRDRFAEPAPDPA